MIVRCAIHLPLRMCLTWTYHSSGIFCKSVSTCGNVMQVPLSLPISSAQRNTEDESCTIKYSFNMQHNEFSIEFLIRYKLTLIMRCEIFQVKLSLPFIHTSVCYCDDSNILRLYRILLGFVREGIRSASVSFN